MQILCQAIWHLRSSACMSLREYTIMNICLAKSSVQIFVVLIIPLMMILMILMMMLMRRRKRDRGANIRAHTQAGGPGGAPPTRSQTTVCQIPATDDQHQHQQKKMADVVFARYFCAAFVQCWYKCSILVWCNICAAHGWEGTKCTFSFPASQPIVTDYLIVSQ